MSALMPASAAVAGARRCSGEGQDDLQAATAACLRWRTGRASRRAPTEVIDPSQYRVAPISDGQAKPFVLRHHYSGSYPVTRFAAGLFRRCQATGAEHLAGVATFGVPMTQAVVPRWLGCEPEAGIELNRFVLLDQVPGNGETWFLCRAMRLLREAKPGLRGVIAFCDPVERKDAAGRLVKRSHTGTIYRAHNAAYLGRTRPRTLMVMPDNKVFSERAAAKLRAQDVGADYAARQLLAAGARHRCLGETPREWLESLTREGFFSPQRHPGNLAFAWTVR